MRKKRMRETERGSLKRRKTTKQQPEGEKARVEADWRREEKEKERQKQIKTKKGKE